MKRALSILALLATMLLVAAPSFAASTCPAFGKDTDCGIILTLNPDGTITITDQTATQPPFDGVEDTMIGVVNNSGKTVTSINLTGNDTLDGGIFNFEGDGIDTFGAPETPGNPDTTGYGGPITFFTNITADQNGDLNSGTANFFGGLATGTNTYFSLEGPLTASSFTGVGIGNVPEPASLMLLGAGFLGLASRLRRRK